MAAHLPLLAVLAVAAVLRTWQLSNNGYGRQYYAAAVRSMMGDWHNFFFNAFDPGGFVSLDKPPIAIWLQVLSAKLIGFNALAMLLPQVIEGLLAVLLVYLIVRRGFGRGAALAAALFLALTPVSIAVDRSNNTESCLIVVLLLATWVAMLAAETQRLALLLVAMALIGVGFNVKMGAAVVLAPTLVLVYLFADRAASWPRWAAAAAAAAAGVVLIVTSLAWVAVYDLTPAGKRPYVGSTHGNSMFELTLLHNGAARFIRPSQTLREASGVDPDATLDAASSEVAGQARPRLWDDSPTGVLRLLRPHQAGQMTWWLPFALAGGFLGWRSAGDPAGAKSRRVAVAIWAGWAASYWLAFSLAGGPFHTYYLAALAPPLAALAGVGVIEAWRRLRAREATRLVLPAVLLAVAGWQTYLVAGQADIAAADWIIWLWVASAAATLLGALALAALTLPSARAAQRRLQPAFAAGIAVAVVAMPIACALSVVVLRPNVAAPAATLANFQHPSAARAQGTRARAALGRDKLIAFLQSRCGGTKFLIAVPNAMVAAPLIMATGAPVMAMGGYVGTDPILTPEELSRRVENGQICFVMLGGFSLATRHDPREQAVQAWVRSNGKPVDAALWRLVTRRAADTYRVRVAEAWVTMATPELFDVRR